MVFWFLTWFVNQLWKGSTYFALLILIYKLKENTCKLNSYRNHQVTIIFLQRKKHVPLSFWRSVINQWTKRNETGTRTTSLNLTLDHFRLGDFINIVFLTELIASFSHLIAIKMHWKWFELTSEILRDPLEWVWECRDCLHYFFTLFLKASPLSQDTSQFLKPAIISWE